MILSRHIVPATIVTGLDAGRRDEAIRELARAIDPARGVKDGDRVHATVIDRGVAVARLVTGPAEPREPTRGSRRPVLSEVEGKRAPTGESRDSRGESDQVVIGLGLSRAGIDFDSFDGSPVRILVLVAAADHDVSRYLEILSALFSLIAEPGFDERLLAAESAEEALAVIRSLEPDAAGAEPLTELCSTAEMN